MAGARNFKELIVWQLADAIRVETLKLTRRPVFQRDLKLHSQTEDAVNSVCRNLAEGFGCETHGEFARRRSSIGWWRSYAGMGLTARNAKTECSLYSTKSCLWRHSRLSDTV